MIGRRRARSRSGRRGVFSAEIPLNSTAVGESWSKRKADESDDSGSDSDSKRSINMLENKMAEVDKQLADFDFGNKSDGEISV